LPLSYHRERTNISTPSKRPMPTRPSGIAMREFGITAPEHGSRTSAITFEVLRDEDHIEEVIARISNLTIARAMFDLAVVEYPGKLIMLCQKGRVLRRSDGPS